MEAKIYILDDMVREVHYPEGNRAVCVSFYGNLVQRSIVQDGVKYEAQVFERVPIDTPGKKPYISIQYVGTYAGPRGTVYLVNDDSPVEGGMSPQQARIIYHELGKALEYLKWFEDTNGSG